jgi:Immunoglobulin-like domain of bacterial spore germination/Sporulation and spore germination
MKRLTMILLAATAMLVSACSTDRSGSRGTVPTDPPPSSQSTVDPPGSATTAPPGPTSRSPAVQPTRTTTVAVWFTRGGKIVPTSRTRPATTATSQLALTELIAGPSAAEAAAGVGTGVPSGTAFEITISGGVATVNLPATFYAGGRDPARLRQAQVVYTLTQFPTVSKVGFQRGGEALGAPLGRADYADLLPAILVSSPLIGQRVSSPITIAGTANVYEATVSVRILDAAGAEIATTFTTATCGSGCRGDYSVAITYRMPREQRATVQVYEVSAENGSRIHVVDIPVTLTA